MNGLFKHGGSSLKDLIYELYKFTGYLDNEYKRVQRPYVEYFKGCENVLDLGTGKGTFLELLSEQNIKGTGVEGDPRLSKLVQEKQLSIIQSDVFEYLKKCKESSYDGIFTSHFIEHLPYEKILELFRLSYKILEPGGRILVVTPNVKSVGLHLGSFYRDFTHITFCHPDVIEFLLTYTGFCVTKIGENPPADSPLFLDIKSHLLEVSRQYKIFGKNKPLDLKSKIKQWVEKIVARYLLRFHCWLLGELNESLIKILDRLDRPSECYLYACKK